MIRKYLTQILIVTVICILYASSTIAGPLSVGPGSKDDRDPHGTGLKFDAQEEVKIKKEWSRVVKVNLNVIGLERVNKERQKRQLRALGLQEQAPKGKDIETVSGAATSPTGTTSTINSVTSSTSAVLPTFVDNSKTPWFPPVRSQGGIGSCVAWAETYYQMSYMVARDLNLNINNTDNTTVFSPKFTYDMARFAVPMGASCPTDTSDCGTYFSAGYSLMEKHGAATWAQFPYDNDYLAWDTNPDHWQQAISKRANPVSYVNSVSTDAGLAQVKQLLTNGYILVYGTYISSWQYAIIKNNPNAMDDDAFVGKSAAYWMNGTNGGHAMTIVGYNDNIWVDVNNNGIIDLGELGALRIVNSWGTGWGDGGFMWVAYDALKAISAVAGAPSTGRVGLLQGDMVYVMTIKNNSTYKPKLLGKFSLDHAIRKQLGITLGISDTNKIAPTTTWSPGAIQNQGGSIAVNGSFVFDMTDLIPSTTSTKRFYVRMADSLADTYSGTLGNFVLMDVSKGTQILANNLPAKANGSTLGAYVDYAIFNGNYAPIAQISSTSTSGAAPLAETFNASASYDPDGTIALYSWNFGDGQTATGAIVSHTYTKAGSFTVTLIVADNLSATGSASTVIVVNPDPNVINAPSYLRGTAGHLSAALQWNDNSSNEGGFVIEQGTMKKGVYSFAQVASVGSNVTGITLTVPAADGYYYRVRAYSTTAPYSSSNPKYSAYSNAIYINIRK